MILPMLGQLGSLLLRGLTLIDGTGRAPLGHTEVIIRDGRIERACPKSELKVPAGAGVGDVAGTYVLPGFINLHGHLANTRGLTQDPRNWAGLIVLEPDPLEDIRNTPSFHQVYIAGNRL